VSEAELCISGLAGNGLLQPILDFHQGGIEPGKPLFQATICFDFSRPTGSVEI
jgi:hypothetical protein